MAGNQPDRVDDRWVAVHLFFLTQLSNSSILGYFFSFTVDDTSNSEYLVAVIRRRNNVQCLD